MVLLLLALVVAPLLAGCAYTDEKAAERAAAEAQAAQAAADKERAEADAYEQRKQADAALFEAKAAIREGERQSFAERVALTTPLVAIILGAVVIVSLALLFWWDLRARPVAGYAPPPYTPAQAQLPARPEIHLHIEAPRNARSRGDYYRALSESARRALTTIDQPGVIVYEADDPRLTGLEG